MMEEWHTDQTPADAPLRHCRRLRRHELRRVAGRRRHRRRRRTPPWAAADEGRRAELPGRGHRGLSGLQLGPGQRRRRRGSATSAPPRRRAWSARSPTGSRSPRSSSTRWGSRSRTPRSSSARRTSSARASAPSSGRTSCRREVVETKLRDAAGRGPARQVALGAVARRAGGRRGLHGAAGAGGDAA